MALKLNLTKAEYDALPDAIKAEYKKGDGDAYALDVTGLEDTGALRRAHDRVKQEAADAKLAAKEAQDKLDALGDDAARKAGDIKTLEASWNTKLATETAARDARIKLLEQATVSGVVDATVAQIAGKLTDHVGIISPHLKSRITAEIGEDGRPAVRILGPDGKISALTPDDLTKEFSTNKDFSAIIRVSKSSGGGANGGGGQQSRNSGGMGGDQSNKPNLATMNPRDLAAQIKANKAEAGNE